MLIFQLISAGLLSNADPPAWHPASQELRDVCKKAAEICQVKQVELLRNGAVMDPGARVRYRIPGCAVRDLKCFALHHSDELLQASLLSLILCR